MEFNPEQSSVVSHITGPILVLAPAGSGKTALLAHRVLGAISKDIPPEEILCLTFTNLASQQLRSRVEVTSPEHARKPWMGTFHGFCASVLHMEAKHVGLPADFVIYDEQDCQELLVRIIKRMGRQERFGKPNDILTLFDNAKAQKERDGLLLQGYDGSGLGNDDYRALYLEYAQEMASRHALDFSDLIYFVRAIFAHVPEIREKWIRRFSFIQVDEVQDTHLAEYEVIKTLAASGNIAFFGDLDQSIYGWRGATPVEVKERFVADFSPTVYSLPLNYRATKTLIRAADSFAAAAFEERFTQLIPADSCPEGDPIVVHHAETEKDEGEWIGNAIKNMFRSSGMEYKDIAILCRSNNKAMQIGEILGEMDVPCLTVDQYQFFRRQEIKDALAFLKLLLNPHDVSAAHRIALRFVKGAGEATVGGIIEEGAKIGLRLPDFFREKTFQDDDPFSELIQAWGAGTLSVMDTETTGLNPVADNIVELAYTLVDSGQIVKERSNLIQSDKSVGSSVHVHGITDERIGRFGVPAVQAFSEFFKDCANNLIVGHNVTFDLSVIQSQASRLGMEMPAFAFADTYELARRFIKADSYRLSDLCAALGLSQGEAHRALGDVKSTISLLETLMPRIRDGQEERRRFTAKYRDIFRPFARRFSLFHQQAKSQRPAELLENMLDILGVMDAYQGEEHRIKNLQHLVSIFRERDQKHLSPPDALRILVQFASLAKNLDHLSDGSNKVIVVPVHQSKGLEFRSVVIAGAVDGSFPHAYSSDDEEEKRIFYVAMTRPKELLTITGHKIFVSRHGKAYDKAMTPFINDIKELKESACRLGMRDSKNKCQDQECKQKRIEVWGGYTPDEIFDMVESGPLPLVFSHWGLSNKDGRTVAHAAARHGHLPADFDRWELAYKDGWTVAHVAAHYGHLPADFDRWELAANIKGTTVAHIAAHYGHLPADFDRWELANTYGCTVAHTAAFYGHLPPDFDRWDLAINNDLHKELAKFSGFTVAHAAAYYGHLPPDFDRWELADKNGRTVAHAAAEHGHLPADFDRWELAGKDGWTVAHTAAYYGHLPADFDRWELANNDGWTVAHAAAEHGHLTPGFDRWDLADKDGTTVYHAAAVGGILPSNFDLWELANKNGWTVAHAAARHGHLPADFDRWELAGKDGWTVAHAAAYYGHLPADFDRWELAGKDGRTVAHAAARHGHLPADFDRWELAGKDGWTVAHAAAYYGHLPADFDRWELAGKDGWTVAHAAAYYGHLPADFDRWELADKDGMSVYHSAAAGGVLPPDFNRWDLVDNNGWTVAHRAAEHGNLPDDFDWIRFGNLRDNQGRTVIDVAMEKETSREQYNLWVAKQEAENQNRIPVVGPIAGKLNDSIIAGQEIQETASEKSCESTKEMMEAGVIWTELYTGMEFVWVPGGTFEMGDVFGNGQPNELPVHEVYLDGFWLGKYPVTQAQWEIIMGVNPSAFKGPNNPVEQVSWDDAHEYINKLNSKSSASGYRLPTEAEWEYTARSGGKKEKYSGGNDVDNVAWFSCNSGNMTHPVGEKLPNGLGIYDMSGNVFEWCQDWYESVYYAYSPQHNPQGPPSGSHRVLRGGCWGSPSRACRAATRVYYPPNSSRDKRIDVRIGVRLAFSPGQEDRPAAPSPSRFKDNGDGTVTDTPTGLMWTKDAYPKGEGNWDDAMAACRAFSISGIGGWRLPSKDELEALYHAMQGGHPFTRVQPSVYWSSTPCADWADESWKVNMSNGYVGHDCNLYPGHVWPVRDSQGLDIQKDFQGGGTKKLLNCPHRR
jgi:DNA helicase II / ATP-dependent DNA helicase PcrA